jgi:hypothetical protein
MLLLCEEPPTYQSLQLRIIEFSFQTDTQRLDKLPKEVTPLLYLGDAQLESGLWH